MTEPAYADDHVVLYGPAEALTVLLELPDETFDLMATDPPYSSGGQYRGDRAVRVQSKYHANDSDALAGHGFSGDNRDSRGFLAWCALWLDQVRRVLKPGGLALMFCDWRQLPIATDAMQAGGLVWRGIVPWDKTGAARPTLGRYTAQCEYVIWGTNGHRELAGPCGPGLVTCPVPRGDDRLHSTPKPVGALTALLGPMLEPGALVLDPFAGSATTLVAAKQLGLRAVGVELDPTYVEVGARRLAQTVLAPRPTQAPPAEVLSLDLDGDWRMTPRELAARFAVDTADVAAVTGDLEAASSAGAGATPTLAP